MCNNFLYRKIKNHYAWLVGWLVKCGFLLLFLSAIFQLFMMRHFFINHKDYSKHKFMWCIIVQVFLICSVLVHTKMYTKNAITLTCNISTNIADIQFIILVLSKPLMVSIKEKQFSLEMKCLGFEGSYLIH